MDSRETQHNTKILKITPADENNQVVSLTTNRRQHLKTPCTGCPWRRSNKGSFPAEAFRTSAKTSYDGSMEKFACHETGVDKVTTCAGFLLRNAYHNIAVRLAMIKGEIDPRTLIDPGAEVLFKDYRQMAIENGVDANDPVLHLCRGNDESAPIPKRIRLEET